MERRLLVERSIEILKSGDIDSTDRCEFAALHSGAQEKLLQGLEPLMHRLVRRASEGSHVRCRTVRPVRLI